jgi:hypothetical protein
MPELKSLLVGDEVSFFCRKCRLNLNGNVASVVTGVVKTVTCRTCRSTQEYVAERSAEEMRSTQLRRAFASSDRRRQQNAVDSETRATASGGPEVTQRWREATEDIDGWTAQRYNKYNSYEVSDIMIHPKEGLGLVLQVVHDNAIVVLFRKVEMPLEMNAAKDDDYYPGEL